MADRLEFQKKLSGLVKLCNEKGKSIQAKEAEAYFGEEGLTREQMDLLYDFLLSQKIVVKGYVKQGGSVRTAADGEKEKTPLSAEEERYLKNYEEELRTVKEDTALSYYLPKVASMARELHRPGIFLGDLVQEGNVGLMLALRQEGASEEEILDMARESMEVLLEEQEETKVKDRKMVKQVRELDEQIRQLTEELGRKVGVDELAEFSGRSEADIADILKLAGEELPDDKTEEEP